MYDIYCKQSWFSSAGRLITCESGVWAPLGVANFPVMIDTGPCNGSSPVALYNGPFCSCQSWSFITVHSQFYSNRLGLYCQVTIWPRKHKKDPFTSLHKIKANLAHWAEFEILRCKKRCIGYLSRVLVNPGTLVCGMTAKI